MEGVKVNVEVFPQVRIYRLTDKEIHHYAIKKNHFRVNKRLTKRPNRISSDSEDSECELIENNIHDDDINWEAQLSYVDDDNSSFVDMENDNEFLPNMNTSPSKIEKVKSFVKTETSPSKSVSDNVDQEVLKQLRIIEDFKALVHTLTKKNNSHHKNVNFKLFDKLPSVSEHSTAFKTVQEEPSNKLLQSKSQKTVIEADGKSNKKLSHTQSNVKSVNSSMSKKNIIFKKTPEEKSLKGLSSVDADVCAEIVNEIERVLKRPSESWSSNSINKMPQGTIAHVNCEVPSPTKKLRLSNISSQILSKSKFTQTDHLKSEGIQEEEKLPLFSKPTVSVINMEIKNINSKAINMDVFEEIKNFNASVLSLVRNLKNHIQTLEKERDIKIENLKKKYSAKIVEIEEKVTEFRKFEDKLFGEVNKMMKNNTDCSAEIKEEAAKLFGPIFKDEVSSKVSGDVLNSLSASSKIIKEDSTTEDIETSSESNFPAEIVPASEDHKVIDVEEVVNVANSFRTEKRNLNQANAEKNATGETTKIQEPSYFASTSLSQIFQIPSSNVQSLPCTTESQPNQVAPSSEHPIILTPSTFTEGPQLSAKSVTTQSDYISPSGNMPKNTSTENVQQTCQLLQQMQIPSQPQQQTGQQLQQNNQQLQHQLQLSSQQQHFQQQQLNPQQPVQLPTVIIIPNNNNKITLRNPIYLPQQGLSSVGNIYSQQSNQFKNATSGTSMSQEVSNSARTSSSQIFQIPSSNSHNLSSATESQPSQASPSSEHSDILTPSYIVLKPLTVKKGTNKLPAKPVTTQSDNIHPSGNNTPKNTSAGNISYSLQQKQKQKQTKKLQMSSQQLQQFQKSQMSSQQPQQQTCQLLQQLQIPSQSQKETLRVLHHMQLLSQKQQESSQQPVQQPNVIYIPNNINTLQNPVYLQQQVQSSVGNIYSQQSYQYRPNTTIQSQDLVQPGVSLNNKQYQMLLPKPLVPDMGVNAPLGSFVCHWGTGPF